MGARDAIAKLISEGIRAFHGSPHDFNAFDAAKIGTGEGAQAYGHGLYFAGNEAVARGYRDALKYKGMDWDNPDVLASYWSNQFGGDRAQAITQLENSLKARSQRNPGNPAVLGAISLLEKDAPFSTVVPKGHMYEVNIGADPNTMLDWDKPLNQQPVVMNQMPPSMLDMAQREAQSRAYAATTKQRSDQLWGMVKDPYQAPGEFFSGGTFKGPLTSGRMSDAGIPGIKYLDAGSRGAGEGTSNYVMFPGSTDLIDIARKYGIAGAAAAPVVGSAMGDTYDQSQYEAQ